MMKRKSQRTETYLLFLCFQALHSSFSGVRGWNSAANGVFLARGRFAHVLAATHFQRQQRRCSGAGAASSQRRLFSGCMSSKRLRPGSHRLCVTAGSSVSSLSSSRQSSNSSSVVTNNSRDSPSATTSTISNHSGTRTQELENISKNTTGNPGTSGNQSSAKSERTIEFELMTSIDNVTAEAWDAYAAAHTGNLASSAEIEQPSSPFLEHAWIQSLEATECASPSTGWLPQHVRIKIDGELAGFVPMYIKSHSMGEFIFDQQWAEAAYQSGIDYYPKLLVGIPFTPVTGPRILWSPAARTNYTSQEDIRKLRRAVGKFLRAVAQANGLSSVHVNFLTDEEATDLTRPLQQSNWKVYEEEESAATEKHASFQKRLRSLFGKRFAPLNAVKDDFLRRTSLQYHWVNVNPKTHRKFNSFDEYLSCFKSKRRITIRRERARVLSESSIRVDAIVGSDILKYDGLVDRMYDIYKSTIDKMLWGRQYLSANFFRRIVQTSFVNNLCFLCARYRDSGDVLRAEDVFAGTFNVIKDGVFYGRYWGCLPEYEVKNLHFEVCYWSAIEYCIDQGLNRMEPGAGGGDYKWARGFDPSLIHSVHYICHSGLRRGVAQFLDFETENNVEVAEYLRERSAVASKA